MARWLHEVMREQQEAEKAELLDRMEWLKGHIVELKKQINKLTKGQS